MGKSEGMDDEMINYFKKLDTKLTDDEKKEKREFYSKHGIEVYKDIKEDENKVKEDENKCDKCGGLFKV